MTLSTLNKNEPIYGNCIVILNSTTASSPWRMYTARRCRVIETNLNYREDIRMYDMMAYSNWGLDIAFFNLLSFWLGRHQIQNIPKGSVVNRINQIMHTSNYCYCAHALNYDLICFAVKFLYKPALLFSSMGLIILIVVN